MLLSRSLVRVPQRLPGYICLLVLLSACGSSQSVRLNNESSDTRPISPAASEAIEARILDLYADWENTPYRLGGSDRRGIDCSAYVKEVYDSAFGIDLPRTTLQQVGVGDPIKKHELQAGDLVFFLPSGKRTRHVGIYLSDGQFTHASTSQGVTTSHLDEAYWQSAYWTARRVVPPEASTVTEADAQSSETPSLISPVSKKKSTKRTGW